MKYLLIILVSILLAAFICEYRGDRWEEYVRTTLYAIRKDSIPNYAKTIVDEKGIPYVHYAAGKNTIAVDEYNPTIVSNYAIDYFEQLHHHPDSAVRNKLVNCADWLLNHISYRNGYALYQFDWKQPFYDSVGVPWTSGMTSGRAMEAFADAYSIVPSARYKEAGDALLRGFYQSIDSGGFTYKENTGWWFEEYADSSLHTPRILDGHIFALLGVWKYNQLAKQESAEYIVQQGIKALKYHLPSYDMGNGWSYYDAYQKPTDKKYHQLLTGLMKELYDSTHDPIFNSYYTKWNAPLSKPYLYRIVKEKNRSGLILFIGVVVMLFVLMSILKKIIFKRR